MPLRGEGKTETNHRPKHLPVGKTLIVIKNYRKGCPARVAALTVTFVALLMPVAAAAGRHAAFPAIGPEKTATDPRRTATDPDSTIAHTRLHEAVIEGAKRVSAVTSSVPVAIIDSAAILRRGITDIGDAMRRLTGVNLRDYGGAGGLKTVSVRSLGAGHTAILLDGMPVGDVRSGQPDISRFSTSRLSSLSLSIGDSPHLLAPVRSLAAATLSIDTPMPRLRQKIQATGGLNFGSFGMVNPSFSLDAPLRGNTAVALSSDFFHAVNDYPFTLENGVDTHRETRTNSRMQAWNAAAALTSGNERTGCISAKATYYNSHRRLPGAVRYYTNKATERIAEQQATGQLMWRRKGEMLNLMAGAKYDWQESLYRNIDAQYPGGELREHYFQQEAYATAGAELKAGIVSAAYAADFFHNALRSNQKTDRRASRDALLQSLSLRLQTARIEATARAIGHLYWNHREEGRPSATVRRITPSASLAFALLRREALTLRLRGHWQQMFRVPTFTESYYRHIGSQTLRPELTSQWGGGLTLALRSATPLPLSLTLTADAYSNRVKDRISAVPVTIYSWRMENIGRLHAAGIDLSLDLRLQLAAKHSLSLASGYSYQRVRDLTPTSSKNYGKAPAYTPSHYGSASASWENPWANLSLHLTACGERWATNEHTRTTQLPAYAEMGISAWRNFRIWGTKLTARTDVINLLDKQYQIVRLYPMPGRSFTIGLKAEF